MGRSADSGAKRLRVLVLLSETYANGGIQRFNRTFLTACDRIGVECDVLSLGDNEESRARWGEPPSVSIRVFNRDKVRFTVAAGTAVLFGDHDFIIIGHVNLLEMVAFHLYMRPLRRSRAMLIAHGIEVWTGMGARSRRLAMRTIDLTLSVSAYTRDSIHAQIPELPRDRLAVFPNALSEDWSQRFSVTGASEDSSIVPGRFLLSVTRLDRGDRYKGIVSVIEAIAMLADTSIHYVIAGTGDDADFLRTVAARCGLSHRVHFTGSLTDGELVSLYRRCEAFVLPSGKEGFGIVFLEAMFFGAPVIAADAKGTVDVVRHARTGLLVPYGDTIALKETIERLLEDSDLRERLCRAGRAEVVDGGQFTFQAYVLRLAKVFAS